MAVSSFFGSCLFLERQHRIITFVSVGASIEGLQGPIIMKLKSNQKKTTQVRSGARGSAWCIQSGGVIIHAMVFMLF